MSLKQIAIMYNSHTNQITDALKLVGSVIALFLALDFIAFVAWIASGQSPVDGFYFGAITANLLKVILL